MTQMTPQATHVNIYPFGGLGEIGMNLLAMEVEPDVVLFDCGMIFQDVSGWGLDYCLPNFTKLYELKDKIRGLVITHGHEDHIGAVGHFANAFPDVPIYASALTKDLIVAKKGDFPILADIKIRLFHDHKPFNVGGFEISAVCVSHSIPDAHGFVIDCAAGRIIHSGDVRYEYDNLRKFEKWFKKNHYFHRYTNTPVLCYLGDSTNVERPHPMRTEVTVAKNLAQFVKDQKDGLLIFSLFASNIERMGSILDAADKYHKKVILCGRSIKTYVDIGLKHGILKKIKGLIIDEQELDSTTRNQVIVISTGSQAEAKAALMRIANRSHRNIHIEEGDQVIMSSRFIPGNERRISHMINALMIQGADVITADDADIHVSGHAYEEESAMTLSALKPQYFIPVHGEYHHMMRHAKLAHSLGSKGPTHTLVIHNGQALSLGADGYSYLPEFDVSKWTYDFGKLVPLVSPPISQRKRLGKHGFIICSIKPALKLFSMGVLIADEDRKACEAYRKKIIRTKGEGDQDGLKHMKAFLQKYFREKYDRRPYIMVTDQEFLPYES